MAIDLITGHQGVAHISAEQIANINNALMDDYGVDKVVRLDDGTLIQDGLTINVGTGFWRVNGFDMEIQEAETVYIDPTATGLSRIDNIYVEILQDIPTGSQRSEIVTVQGEAAASPVAPDAPTAPVLNTDILLQVTPLATVTVTEGAMVMTDLSVAYEMVTPSELEAVETAVTDIVNVYGAKNLLPNNATTQTINGVTFTVNSDGTITASGTATASGALIPVSILFPEDIKAGTYTLSGVDGGSNSTYKMWVGIRKADNSGYVSTSYLYDGETTVTIPSEFKWVRIETEYTNGYSGTYTFKPMLRLASIEDDTYVPYSKTNKELTEAFTNQVADSDDAYSPSKAYKVGEHCIYNNVLYKCVTACSAAAWSVNQNCFEATTLTSAVTDLNNDLTNITSFYLSPDIALGGGFTGGAAKYMTFGDLCFVYYSCYYAGALNVGVAYQPFAGFPIPKNPDFVDVKPSFGGQPYDVNVNNNGALIVIPRVQIPANTYLKGIFVYIKA